MPLKFAFSFRQTDLNTKTKVAHHLVKLRPGWCDCLYPMMNERFESRHFNASFVTVQAPRDFGIM